ncbi:MAG: N-acetylglucosamine-6-phosphate deacetylase [Candidatus Neomarinimicrobiota bacterium]
MHDHLIIRNCRLYNQLSREQPTDILIIAGKIARLGSVDTDMDQSPIIDADGRTTIPGLIDVHIHGAGGGDTSHGTPQALNTISTTLARLGITSFLATAMTRPEIGNEHLKITGQLVGQDLGGANLLGLHLEGPFISRVKRGGIPLNAIKKPSRKALDELIQITGDNLKMMTIAPEVDGALTVIQAMVDHGIIASFGHSDANYIETQRGLEAGISHVTHIFNTMRPLHHRDPGPVPAIFEHPDVTVQVISDGLHLHEKMVRYIYQQFGGERCVCITDGMQAMGLPAGRYYYYGQEFESQGGAARYLDGTLIGTTYSLHQLMLKFWDFTGCNLETAVDTAARNPATVLGLVDRKGSIELGKDADLVVLDHDHSVWATIIGGRLVYTKEEVQKPSNNHFQY